MRCMYESACGRNIEDDCEIQYPFYQCSIYRALKGMIDDEAFYEAFDIPHHLRYAPEASELDETNEEII